MEGHALCKIYIYIRRERERGHRFNATPQFIHHQYCMLTDTGSAGLTDRIILNPEYKSTSFLSTTSCVRRIDSVIRQTLYMLIFLLDASLWLFHNKQTSSSSSSTNSNNNNNNNNNYNKNNNNNNNNKNNNKNSSSSNRNNNSNNNNKRLLLVNSSSGHFTTFTACFCCMLEYYINKKRNIRVPGWMAVSSGVSSAT